MTTTQLVLGLVCVTLGATVHSTIGFGAALLSVPLLLLINPDFVPGPITVASLAVNLFVLSANRGHADWRGVRWAGLGLLPGTALGAVALTLFTGSSLAVLAGSAVLVAVAVCAAGSRLPEGRRALLGAGSSRATWAPPPGSVARHWSWPTRTRPQPPCGPPCPGSSWPGRS
ncbi:MAG: TSUP family transporter [Acidimicrobiia bacterium]|nr:TSUP family transporter [Acidimicrobiia bacterium]